MNKLTTLALVSLLTLMSGCATVIETINEDPIQVDPTERSWGNWIDDQTIETIAGVNIKKADPAFDKSRVKVVSFNGTVLLIGQVTNGQLKDLAETTVRDINHVGKVYNELTIGAPASILQQSNDSWLTTKIKTKLIQSEVINADRIKINTEQGAVYLMGLVSPKQAQTSVDIVRNTGGVQKIIKVFEYIK
ncbi:phospholipid-binding protein [Endozoicomonas sp. OPT23]|uniref:BON domain-containing protein n=1 Tax=Endozoicomonas sp. OPT23 TaxID=2072845 RepID=UPI00129A43CA|nr:BON domain-containing protein [Endozoicomonas sp. OPT23]MRI35393.1 phospholipid-binding protein [Endozoicomonas sp. OPT23]